MKRPSNLKVAAAAIVALALVAAACGDDDQPLASTTAPTTTVTTTTTAATTTTTTTSTTTTTVPPPEGVSFIGADGVEMVVTDTSRIVSLSGDVTEVIYELGLGENIVAIDVTTTFPEAATSLPVVGFGQQLAPEPVLAFEPTLVIGDELTAPSDSVELLRGAGVPVVILETQITLDGVLDKINQIAGILGVEDEGNALAERVGKEIDDALALAAKATEEPRVAYVYIRGPGTVLLFGQFMPTNAMIKGAHGLDVAAARGVLGAVPLTPEALIAAEPDVIVLPTGGLTALGGLEALNELPGIAQTPAGQSGTFLDYEEAYFFNLGPRAGQALMEFVLDLHPELAPDS